MSDNPDYITAWRSDPEWREFFLETAARELSKHGEFDEDDVRVLAALSPHLSTAEIVRIYRALQRSNRLDCEWRGVFMSLFPAASEADLPTPPGGEEAATRWADEARARDVSRAR